MSFVSLSLFLADLLRSFGHDTEEDCSTAKAVNIINEVFVFVATRSLALQSSSHKVFSV